MRYKVIAREIWTQEYEVEADSPAEARDLVNMGKGEAIDNTLDYSETCDKFTFEVEVID